VQGKLLKGHERLSSGKRINSASDDAAGLSIASKMEGRLRGSEQGMRNSKDAISMLRTAEDALSHINNIIVRLRELATQSANGVLNDSERAYIQQEAIELTREVDRVSRNTEFHGKKLLDGTDSGPVKFQVDTESNEQIEFTLGSATAVNLGMTSVGTRSADMTTTSGATVGHALMASTIDAGNNAAIAEQALTVTDMDGVDHTINLALASGNKSAKAIVEAVNTLGITGVSAEVEPTIATIGGLNLSEADNVELTIQVGSGTSKTINYFVGESDTVTQDNLNTALFTAFNDPHLVAQGPLTIASMNGENLGVRDVTIDDNAALALGNFGGTAAGSNISFALGVTGGSTEHLISFTKGNSASEDMDNLYDALVGTVNSNNYRVRKDQGNNRVILSRNAGIDFTISSFGDNAATTATGQVWVHDDGAYVSSNGTQSGGPANLIEGGDFNLVDGIPNRDKGVKLGGFSNSPVGGQIYLTIKDGSDHTPITINFTKGSTTAEDMDNLAAALSGEQSSLSGAGYSFYKSPSDNTVVLVRSTGRFTIDDLRNDMTQMTLGSIYNTKGATVQFKLDGQAISYTAAGTADPSTNASRLQTALSNAGFTATQSGTSVVVNKTGDADFLLTAFDDNGGASALLGQHIRSEEGSTISFNVEGTGHADLPVSFTKGPSATVDATNLYNALTGGPSASALAAAGYTFDNDGTAVMISRFTSDDDGFTIDDYRNDRSKMTFQNFTNYSGDTVSFNLDGVSVSFIGAGSSDGSTNASRLTTALINAGFNSGTYTVVQSGSSVELTKIGEDDFSLTNYDAVREASAKIGGFGSTRTGGNIGMVLKGDHSDITVSFTKGATATDDMDNLYSALAALGSTLTNEGYSFSKSTSDDKTVLSRSNDRSFSIDEVANHNSQMTFSTFSNLAGGSVSFDLDGTNISFSSGGSGDQSTNATNLSSALNAAGFSASESGGVVTVDKSGNADFAVTNYAGSMSVSAKLGSFSNTITGADASFKIKGDHSDITVTFTKGATATDDMNRLYTALGALGAGLTDEGYSFSKDTSDNTVVLTRNNGPTFTIDEVANNKSQMTFGNFAN